MPKYTNSSGISVNVTPYFDSGFIFDYLHMKEELGGSLPFGEIGLLHDGSPEALKLVEEQDTGHITLEREGGNIYEIDFFITERGYRSNFLTLKFVCVPNREFYTDLKTSTWDDITSAIKSLYPGKIDLRCDSDVNNGVQFFQQRETDYDFCYRLCSSFKHDIVFGFGWEGLMLKETISKDHTGNQEPYWKIWGETEVSQITPYNFKYNRDLYEAPLNPWEQCEGKTENLPDRTNLESLNCCVMRTYGEYRIMGRDHYQALENRRYNLRYLDSSLWNSIKTVDINLPDWKLGDVVKYFSKWQEADGVSVPFDIYIVKANEVFFSPESSSHISADGLKFSWTTTMLGLQTSTGSVQPREDPTDKD